MYEIHKEQRNDSDRHYDISKPVEVLQRAILTLDDHRSCNGRRSTAGELLQRCIDGRAW